MSGNGWEIQKRLSLLFREKMEDLHKEEKNKTH